MLWLEFIHVRKMGPVDHKIRYHPIKEVVEKLVKWDISPGRLWRTYFPGTLSCSQVTATRLKIGHLLLPDLQMSCNYKITVPVMACLINSIFSYGVSHLTTLPISRYTLTNMVILHVGNQYVLLYSFLWRPIFFLTLSSALTQIARGMLLRNLPHQNNEEKPSNPNEYQQNCTKT